MEKMADLAKINDFIRDALDLAAAKKMNYIELEHACKSIMVACQTRREGIMDKAVKDVATVAGDGNMKLM